MYCLALSKIAKSGHTVCEAGSGCVCVRERERRRKEVREMERKSCAVNTNKFFVLSLKHKRPNMATTTKASKQQHSFFVSHVVHSEEFKCIEE